MAEGDNESKLGKEYVGVWGVFIMAAYLVLFTIGALYVTVKVWPPSSALSGTLTPTPTRTPTPTPAGAVGAPTPTPAPTAASTSPSGATEPKWPLTFFWCSNGEPDGFCWISMSTSLFLISILLGALGSLLHALRSFYWYVGNRQLVLSWSAMYLLLPFCGAALAAIFYIVMRGGFIPQSNLQSANPFAFAAMGAIVGLFSDQAMEKLKQVAQTFFAQAPSGKDTALPPPKVASISPNAGPAAGGTHVNITGTNFVSGAKVNIGGTPATQIVVTSPTSITAVTPSHGVGPVDVEVVNHDDQKDTLKGAFTYS